jgi:hypothetical protein
MYILSFTPGLGIWSTGQCFDHSQAEQRALGHVAYLKVGLLSNPEIVPQCKSPDATSAPRTFPTADRSAAVRSVYYLVFRDSKLSLDSIPSEAKKAIILVLVYLVPCSSSMLFKLLTPQSSD